MIAIPTQQDRIVAHGAKTAETRRAEGAMRYALAIGPGAGLHGNAVSFQAFVGEHGEQPVVRNDKMEPGEAA